MQPMPQALLSEIEKCWHRHRKLWPDRTINLALAIHGQVDPVTGRVANHAASAVGNTD